MTEEWPYKNLNDFLEKIGIKDRATPQQLEEYRQIYKREYHKHYQRQHRQENPEFTLNFTRSQAKQLKTLACADGLSVQQYIKRLTLEVLGNPVRVQSQVTIETKQVLSNIYSEIQNLIRNDFHDNVGHQNLYKELLERIESIEELIDSEVWS